MTKQVNVGGVLIGGGATISVQSMTNTKTLDIEKTTQQINVLKGAGCDIVRIAVSNDNEVIAASSIIKNIDVPLVADIQFDYKLAIKCSDIGFKKVRFNPGNIGSEKNVAQLVAACKSNHTPIRIGVNSGSIEKDILLKFGRSATALAESALTHVRLLEKFGFYDTVISVKSSDVKEMTDAYKILSTKCDYPLHLGVTESGARESGLVKSAIGIGSLLNDGIGDTIRVSLTGDPIDEVKAARLILKSLKLLPCATVVSCPTCSRCNVDLLSIVDKVTKLTENITRSLKIAVMGCVVNGPGEAKDADFGVAGGLDKSIIFEKGEVIATVDNSQILCELSKLIEKYKEG